MSSHNNQDKPSPEYQLLQRIDKRLESMEHQMDNIETKAARYGAVAGGITGGIVATGILIAKMKLGA